uniref:PPM-type phosphatase domain-containing protein n=1 Tax=Strigamia maritima TaxID=126957 RepID=T1IXX6_STRMM
MAEDGAGVSSEFKFFEEFSKNEELISIEDDGIQLRSSSCYVNEDDFDGEVTDCALHYLYSQFKKNIEKESHFETFFLKNKCPHLLAAAVARVTRDELKLTDLSECQLRENGEVHNIRVLDASKLQDVIRHKVHEICEQWRQNPIFTSEKQKSWPVSCCAVKNTRRRMEDKHVLIPDLNIFFGLEDKSPQGFFAIFDGHAGTEAANYASVHLHHHIVRHPDYSVDIHAAVKDGFKKTDDLFIEKCKRENLKCGCTAICSLIQENALHIAWVGDSQAFLIEKGIIKDVVTPHRPSREDERKRVEEQGGCVVYFGTWRVNGTLAISRAIGDSEFKPYVCSEPDIVTIPRVGNEDFLIMACDGLWDVTTPEDAALTVYKCLINAPDNIDDISEKLVQLAVQRGSTDNITIIVIFLRDPKEISQDGVPEPLKNALNVAIHQESKLPDGIITNGESPTKIPNNLWMNKDEDAQLLEENRIQVGTESKVENIAEYFLPQTEEETKNMFSIETLNLESNNQISLSTFDSAGAMAMPTPPQSPKSETKLSPQIVPIDVGVLETDSNVVSHSNLSPSAPVFIPHSFLAQMQPNATQTEVKLDADYDAMAEDAVFVGPIPDTAPVAEDVVDDESEEGEDWRYLTGSGVDANAPTQQVCDLFTHKSTEATELKLDFDPLVAEMEVVIDTKEVARSENTFESTQSAQFVGLQLDFDPFVPERNFEEISEVKKVEDKDKVDEMQLIDSKENTWTAADENSQIETCLMDIIADEPFKDSLNRVVDLMAESEHDLMPASSKEDDLMPASSKEDALMIESAPQLAASPVKEVNDDFSAPSVVSEKQMHAPEEDALMAESAPQLAASPVKEVNEDFSAPSVGSEEQMHMAAAEENALTVETAPQLAASPVKEVNGDLWVPSVVSEEQIHATAAAEKEEEESAVETPKSKEESKSKQVEPAAARKVAASKSPTKTPVSKSKMSAAASTARTSPTAKPITQRNVVPKPATTLGIEKKMATKSSAKTDKPLTKTKATATSTSPSRPEVVRSTKSSSVQAMTTSRPVAASLTKSRSAEAKTTTSTTRNVGGASKLGLKKTLATSTVKTTTTVTSRANAPTSATSTVKRATASTFPRNTTTKTSASASASANTKDSKETVNKQILTKTTTTTTSRSVAPAKTAPVTMKKTTTTTLTRPATTLKKAASATSAAAATVAATVKQKRPTTAPPARPRPRTASGLKNGPEGHKKEKGTLDEKTKEGVGHGDEAAVGNNEDSANPNQRENGSGSGDLA